MLAKSKIKTPKIWECVNFNDRIASSILPKINTADKEATQNNYVSDSNNTDEVRDTGNEDKVLDTSPEEENETMSSSLRSKSDDPIFKDTIIKNIVKLKFPFSFGLTDRISVVETNVERVSDIVSFCLPYDLLLFLSDAELISKEYSAGAHVYVFQFCTLDSALEWMNDKTVFVDFKPRNGNLVEIRNEMNEIMSAYETKESSRKRKKVKKIDEDGFTYYE